MRTRPETSYFQVDARVETRESTFTSLLTPTPLTHDCGKLIGQERAERTALLGRNGSCGLQQLRIKREGDLRLHGTPR